MKKSQRARLVVLTAQSSRNEAEQVEFSTLTALAAQHPDASKDTDDAAPAPVPAPASTLATILSAALATVRSKGALGADIAQAQAQITALTGERDAAVSAQATLTTERDTARADVSAANAQLATLASFFGIDAAAISGKASAEVTALITAKVDALVTDQIAALGFPKNELPAPRGGDAPVNAEKDLAEQIKNETDPDKRAALHVKWSALGAKNHGKN